MAFLKRSTIVILVILAIFAVIYRLVRVKKDILGKPRLEIVIKLCPNALKTTPFTGEWFMNVFVTTLTAFALQRLVDCFFVWISEHWADRPRTFREFVSRSVASLLKLTRVIYNNIVVDPPLENT